MDDYQLNEGDLVVVAVVNAEIRMVNSENQVVDEVVDDPEAHHVFDEMRK